MEADKQLVEKIAKLARLEFKEKEMEKMVDDFQKIVAFMSKLHEVDTSEVELGSNVLPLNRARLDEPEKGLDRTEILKRAPFTNNEFFRVPKVLKK